MADGGCDRERSEPPSRYDWGMVPPPRWPRLAVEHATTSERVIALRTELAWLAGDSEDANGDDEHDPEGSTLAFERARVAALLDDAESHLEQLALAQDRVAAGTYALCDVCGGAIPSARLDALPATRTCIDCATTATRG